MEFCASFPSISKAEFSDASQHLLGLFASQRDSCSEWLHIEVKPSELPIQQLRIERAIDLIDSCRREQHVDLREDLVEDEIHESDEDALPNLKPDEATRLIYDITLSETYQVPVLHFRFRRNGKTIWPSVEQVYQAVVASTYSAELANTGVMGGISMTNHPLDGGPSFFVHPCRTADALQTSTAAVKLTTFQYLQLWFGIIGGPIGLAIPAEILNKHDPSPSSTGF